MLVQQFTIDDYDWTVKVYYAVDRYYVSDILHDLDKLNIANEDYFTVKDTWENQTLNIGFTYTDYYKKSTIVIIGLTTSAAEFQDTFDHEKGHVAMHISSYYHLNPYGEKCQYLQGEIGKKMFPYAKQFLCDHCRENFTLYN